MRRKTYKKKNNGAAIAFGCLVIPIVVLAIAGFTAFNWYNSQVNSSVGSEEERVEITVEEGQTFFDIAPTLVENNLLSDENVLRIYFRLENPELNLQKGTYQVQGGKNIPELIERFNQGPEINSIQVTIPEGWRFDQVADRMANSFNEVPDSTFNKNEYLNLIRFPDETTFSENVQTFLDNHKPKGKNLEGFIFPDTYVFGTDATTKQILELQLSNLIRRLEDAGIDPNNVGRMGNFYDALIVASIVEREAGQQPEKPKVADIFVKRYEQNTLLGADATLLYQFKDWAHELTISEIEDTGNPYNTRANVGLTPTPISNPGMNAIEATVNPANTPYFYFITGLDGKNYYAEDFAGHARNIANYL